MVGLYFTPTVTLTGFAVQYIDMRALKPRDILQDTFILDSATIAALGRTNQAVPDFIRQRYELGGYRVCSVEKICGKRQIVMDLRTLWDAAEK